MRSPAEILSTVFRWLLLLLVVAIGALVVLSHFLLPRIGGLPASMPPLLLPVTAGITFMVILFAGLGFTAITACCSCDCKQHDPMGGICEVLAIVHQILTEATGRLENAGTKIRDVSIPTPPEWTDLKDYGIPFSAITGGVGHATPLNDAANALNPQSGLGDLSDKLRTLNDLIEKMCPRGK